VDITAPGEPIVYSTCQEFEVWADVTNTGAEDALDVTVTLSVMPEGSARVTEGGYTQYVGDIVVDETVVVYWPMHCKAACDSTITVTPAGIDAGTDEPIPDRNIFPDSITVKQQEKAHLVAEIVYPVTSTTITVCQDFEIHFTIANIGEAEALDVQAEIDPGARAEVDALGEGVPWITGVLGDIPGGGVIGPFTTELHCCSVGDTTITVTPSGTDANTSESITNITPDTVVVHQEPVPPEPEASLLVEIGSPGDGTTYSTCMEFDVDVAVWNIGTEDALGVTLTLSVVPEGSARVTEGGYSENVGNLIPGAYAEVIFPMHCKVGCDTTITVTAAGTDAGTGEAIPDSMIYPDSITVKQEEKPHLVANILYPVTSTEFAVCQDFELHFTISNTGAADALDVQATIDPGAHAEVDALGEGVPYLTGILDDIPGGGVIGPFSYEMHCTSVGDTVITVTPSGTDENGAGAITNITPDSVVVHQVEAPVPTDELWVEISYPNQGEMFYKDDFFVVTATVGNTGDADAIGVDVTISNENLGPVDILDPVTQIIDVPAGEERVVYWDMQAEIFPGFAVIQVEAVSSQALDVVTVEIDPIPTMELVEGINMISYSGATWDLPEALTNIGPDGLDVVEILWARGAWTGGDWLFYDATSPIGSTLHELEHDQGYIIVVTADCTWELPY
jgi:hypothetical protein